MKIGEDNRVRAQKVLTAALFNAHPSLPAMCVAPARMDCCTKRTRRDGCRSRRCGAIGPRCRTPRRPLGDRQSWKEMTKRAPSIQHPTSSTQHPAPSTHDPMASMQISVGRAPSSSPWQAQHCARMCDRRWVR